MVSYAQTEGIVDFRNHIWGVLAAPVLDFDGNTPLAGASFIAQLYVGPTPDSLAPVGDSSRFLNFGELAGAGYWVPAMIRVPIPAPGLEVWVQVRVSELVPASTFPRSAPRGGSNIFKIRLGDEPAMLIGLRSFSLQPEALSLQRQDDQVVIRWLHAGAVTYRLERATALGPDAVWLPVFEEVGLERFRETLSVTRPADADAAFFRLWRSR
jgi:hypothetical protein